MGQIKPDVVPPKRLVCAPVTGCCPSMAGPSPTRASLREHRCAPVAPRSVSVTEPQQWLMVNARCDNDCSSLSSRWLRGGRRAPHSVASRRSSGGRLKWSWYATTSSTVVSRAVTRTADMSVLTLKMFGRMLIGEASLKNLTGPLTIADYAGQSVRVGTRVLPRFSRGREHQAWAF